MLDATGADDLVPCIPELVFFRNPYTMGDVAEAAWLGNLARGCLPKQLFAV